MDMIERVADAIEAKMRTSDNYPEDLARAAIEAIREMGSPCGVCGCAVYPIDAKIDA
jgi:hypothetical protein